MLIVLHRINHVQSPIENLPVPIYIYTINIYMYPYIRIYIYMYIYVYIYIYVYMYIYMYIYIYIYIIYIYMIYIYYATIFMYLFMYACMYVYHVYINYIYLLDIPMMTNIITNSPHSRRPKHLSSPAHVQCKWPSNGNIWRFPGVGVKFLGNPAAAKPPEIGIIYVHIICIYIYY